MVPLGCASIALVFNDWASNPRHICLFYSWVLSSEGIDHGADHPDQSTKKLISAFVATLVLGYPNGAC